MSDSLRPHGLQHTRLPCPSSTPRAYEHSCPSSQWCHQPSHSLSSPSSPTFIFSQHRCLFQWVRSSQQVAKVLELQLQHQSFQWILGLISFRIDWFDLLVVQGMSRVFSSTTVQRHQFFGALPSLRSSSHYCTWPLGKLQPWLYGPLLIK